MLRDSAAVDTPAARPHFIAQDGHHLFAWHHPARPAVRRGAAVGALPIARRRIGARLPSLATARRAACRHGFRRVSFRLRGHRRLRRRCDRTRSGRGLAPQHRSRSERGAGTHRLARGRTRRPAHQRHAGGAGGGCAWWRRSSRPLEPLPFRPNLTCANSRPWRVSARSHTSTRKTMDRISSPPAIILPRPVASALEQLDLDALPVSPAPHVLLVERDDRSPDPEVGDRLQSLGSCVTRVRPAGTGSMLEPGVASDVPTDALDAITSLARRVAVRWQRGVRIEDECRWQLRVCPRVRLSRARCYASVLRTGSSGSSACRTVPTAQRPPSFSSIQVSITASAPHASTRHSRVSGLNRVTLCCATTSAASATASPRPARRKTSRIRLTRSTTPAKPSRSSGRRRQAAGSSWRALLGRVARIPRSTRRTTGRCHRLDQPTALPTRRRGRTHDVEGLSAD